MKLVNGLTRPQIRVLQVLCQTGGVLTRTKIAERIGAIKAVSTAWAIGYSDPAKRAAFKLTKDGSSAGTPLLDLGYVEEVELDIDGKVEVGVRITELGQDAYNSLPPEATRLSLPVDKWAVKKGRA